MTKVLVLTSSVSKEQSVSTQLVRGALAALRRHVPEAKVTERDLGLEPLPHLTPDLALALNAAPTNKAERAARALSDHLVKEVQAADVLLIAAPMYNFGIPSTLKAWFDHVLRSGITFRYDPDGQKGLLTGKRAIIVSTRGGYYGDAAGKLADSLEPHLKTLLGFVGITDVIFVRAEKLAFGPEERARAISAAHAELEALVTRGSFTPA